MNRSPILALLVTAGLMFTVAASAQMPAGSARAAAKPSASLRVLAGERELVLSADELHALPHVSVTVHNAHSNADEHYTGVALTDLLVQAGTALGKNTLHSYVVATGTDGYWVLLSGEEINAAAHSGTVLVATEREGQPIGADGLFKLIASDDKKPERWVRNLETIRWVEVKP